MRLPDLAAGQQLAIGGRTIHLPRLQTDFVNSRVERCVAAQRRIDAHGSGNRCRRKHIHRREQAIECECI